MKPTKGKAPAKVHPKHVVTALAEKLRAARVEIDRGRRREIRLFEEGESLKQRERALTHQRDYFDLDMGKALASSNEARASLQNIRDVAAMANANCTGCMAHKALLMIKDSDSRYDQKIGDLLKRQVEAGQARRAMTDMAPDSNVLMVQAPNPAQP